MGWIITIVAVLLVVVGFILPPTGVIDGSVLTAVGELIGLRAVCMLPDMIHRGSDVTIQHGNTSVTVNNPDNTEE